ncbi:hypothetical protein, partial [Polycladidibacter hongkongensis]|uniref:hypothetical protein n=1 Tax=Polycladidibacter hongkongensis TaxID=1647556 RepID=UPI000A740DDC
RLRFSFLHYKIVNEHEKIKQPILSLPTNRRCPARPPPSGVGRVIGTPNKTVNPIFQVFDVSFKISQKLTATVDI